MRLIYLSPIPWESFNQRPHELVNCFHEKTGEPVLWLEPYPTRFPVRDDLRRLREKTPAHAGERPSWLTVLQPHALPIEPAPGSGWINRLLWQSLFTQVRDFARQPTQLGIGKPSKLALMLLREPVFTASFYDAMDNFPEFYEGQSRKAMARCQRLTAESVSQVLASSSALHAQMMTFSNNVKLLGNACASERLPARREQCGTHCHAPVLGYVGTIAKWFAWDIVVAMAKAFPHAEVHLIGPVHTHLPDDLPDNIKLFGEVRHDEAVQAMTRFDVGLIPFKCSALTQFVDPIKYYEYRALGLPVISTAFGEMAVRASYPGTFILDGAEDIHRVVKNALRFEESADQTQHFRNENSWRARFSTALP